MWLRVKLYNATFTAQPAAIAHCQSEGGELFEFDDFDQQYEYVFNYLIANGGKALLEPEF